MRGRVVLTNVEVTLVRAEPADEQESSGAQRLAKDANADGQVAQELHYNCGLNCTLLLIGGDYKPNKLVFCIVKQILSF